MGMSDVDDAMIVEEPVGMQVAEFDVDDWSADHDSRDEDREWFGGDLDVVRAEKAVRGESRNVSHAMIMQQQKKIGELESDLNAAQAEIRRLKNQAIEIAEERRKNKSQGQEKKSTSRYWTAEEHQRFLEGLSMFGHRDVKAISNHVATRNATQVRTHAQKYYLRLSRQANKTGEGGSLPAGNSPLQNSTSTGSPRRTSKTTVTE